MTTRLPHYFLSVDRYTRLILARRALAPTHYIHVRRILIPAVLLATVILRVSGAAGNGQAATGMPTYTSDSIVNAATSTSPVSVGTLVSIYGDNLSFDTAAVGPQNISGRNLPTSLAGTRVLLDNSETGLYFVSPKQINFLIGPSTTTAKEILVQVATEGRAGPAVKIQLATAAPGLFLSAPEYAIGTRADGSVVSKDSPTRPGEVIVLYATGLGATNPLFGDRELPNRAAPLTRMSDFQVQLNGDTLTPGAVFYAGVTPGFAGLYQVNLRLPSTVADDPEIRIGFQGQMSPAGVKLPLKFAAAANQ